MHQLQRSWVRSQHPSAQWNLRGGKCAVLNIVRKKIKNPPKKYLEKKSYMTNDLLTSEQIIAHFLIYQEALPHIWLFNSSHLNLLIYEENFILFFYQCICMSSSEENLCRRISGWNFPRHCVHCWYTQILDPAGLLLNRYIGPSWSSSK